ncbi:MULTISPECIES: histidine phosphatase family protein [unclassified Paenibacillus]|uniref:histidine phosphatase family protein n=1 Tax=unclassified Paenibacillus TaxID=185978 RepID=UPI001AE7F0FC|nr:MULTISPECIES: histidine phosphatase family protein [unclassified Paenibacillus]MBP1157004.1 broad specificity phosphatase PhoE [Paenibacillus sp. PvP091]MBP1172257.1 broad specificity phosphatase PhoE [Paenibacillus sp. PvR098]MBP2438638.1 broad specificity phosphatase PhoE [Paenibacillus sp. PvP052]
MKIGLVRHFKVKKDYPANRLVSTDEVMQWFKEYDEAQVEKGQTDLAGIEWSRCFSSDLSRALFTAKTIYDGQVDSFPELREIPAPRFKLRMKLPFLWWAILIRVSWIANRQTRLDLKHAETRVKLFLDEVVFQSQENVLIVSHAGLMMSMRKELMRRGFHGPRYKIPDNGKLYVFEK